MKTTFLVVLSLISTISIAQNKAKWENLEQMKTVMKASFQPMMKNNDLAPARKNAAELYTKALALQNGDKPKAFRKKSMLEAFELINTHALKLKNQAEKNASDDDLKDTLVSLHAAFAEIAHHKKAGKHEH